MNTYKYLCDMKGRNYLGRQVISTWNKRVRLGIGHKFEESTMTHYAWKVSYVQEDDNETIILYG